MDTILFIVMTDHDVRLAFYIGEVHYMEKRDGQLWPTDNFIEAGTQGFPPEWHALHARLHRERATPSPLVRLRPRIPLSSACIRLLETANRPMPYFSASPRSWRHDSLVFGCSPRFPLAFPASKRTLRAWG